MGGVLGRLFKVKKLELVMVGIENRCAALSHLGLARTGRPARAAPPPARAAACG